MGNRQNSAGEFTLYADGETYFAKEGDILLLGDGMLHGGTPHNCIYECLSFDLRGLFSNVLSVKSSIRPFYRGNFLPIVFYENYHHDVYPIVDELLCSFSKDMSDDICTLTTLGNLSRLFAAIRENHSYTENTKDTFETTRKITQIKPVLEYIEAESPDDAERILNRFVISDFMPEKSAKPLPFSSRAAFRMA